MIVWEDVKSKGGHVHSICRARVPGGWLIRVSQADGEGLTFYPDSKHEWNASSI